MLGHLKREGMSTSCPRGRGASQHPARRVRGDVGRVWGVAHGHGPAIQGKTCSSVLHLVTLHSKYNRALNFPRISCQMPFGGFAYAPAPAGSAYAKGMWVGDIPTASSLLDVRSSTRPWARASRSLDQRPCSCRSNAGSGGAVPAVNGHSTHEGECRESSSVFAAQGRRRQTHQEWRCTSRRRAYPFEPKTVCSR
jgi:hypothetical protein